MKIKGEHDYYALLCYCTDGDPLICGVFSTRGEAKKEDAEVKQCPAKHKIKKCKLEIVI